MKVFRIEVESEKGFELIPIFDLHLGSRFTDYKLWNRVKNYIKEKENTWCYIGGDLLEFIPLGDKRFHLSNYTEDFLANGDNILSYSIEKAISELWDIKDKILFMHGGNHETAYLGKYGIDAIQMIANGLNLSNYTSNHECFVTIYFKDAPGRIRQFFLYSHHGVGASQKGGTLLNRVEDLAISYQADVYVMGHSHQLGFLEKPYFTLDRTGKMLKEKKRYFLRIGGFRKARVENIMGYEEKLGYRPNGYGTFIIRPIRVEINFNLSKKERIAFGRYDFQIINFS